MSRPIRSKADHRPRILRLSGPWFCPKCVAQIASFEGRVRVRPGENRLRLAEFLFRRGKFNAAVAALGPYFAAGGQDVDAAYTYARALGETGRMEDAAKYFDYVLGLKPETLQVTVAQAYVRLLVRNGRFEDALRTIDRVRGRDRTIAHFMEPEYRSIRARRGSRDS